MAPDSKAAELLARIEQQKQEIPALKTLWEMLYPEFPVPDTRQWQIWRKMYDFDLIVAGLETANVKFARRAGSECVSGPMTNDDVVRYASGTMRGLKQKGDAQ
jgi:hypothetical protein